MTKMGYKFDTDKTGQVYGENLTVDEQSILRKEMDSVGSLNYVEPSGGKSMNKSGKIFKKQ